MMYGKSNANESVVSLLCAEAPDSSDELQIPFAARI
jgi:hypothetical protein